VTELYPAPRLRRLSAALVGLTLACHPVPDEERPAQTGRALSPPIQFSYGTTLGEEFSSSQTYGRVTVILFVTTFDLASQVAAARVNELLHLHRPRINAGAIVLEAPKYAPLAEAFRSALRLDYPVAIADDATRTGGGPFGAVDRVPTVVVLDRTGREAFRRAGIVPARELYDAVTRAER
jgi:hypothetical protein